MMMEVNHSRDLARHEIDCDKFRAAKNEYGSGNGVHCRPVPEHPFYRQRHGWKPEHWPHAMRLGRQTVSLPLSPKLTDADVERVIGAVRAIVA